MNTQQYSISYQLKVIFYKRWRENRERRGMGECGLSVQEETEGEGSGGKVWWIKYCTDLNSDLQHLWWRRAWQQISPVPVLVSVGGGEVLQANCHQQKSSKFSKRPWRSRKIHSTSLWSHADWHTPLGYIHAQMKAYSMCMCAHTPATWRKDFRSWLKSTGKSQCVLGWGKVLKMLLCQTWLFVRVESRVTWTVNCN